MTASLNSRYIYHLALVLILFILAGLSCSVKPNPAAVQRETEALSAEKERQLFIAQITPPDSDGDGLSNALEAMFGTDQKRVDTDKDGQNDHDEVSAGFNPLGSGSLAESTNDTIKSYGTWYFRLVAKTRDAQRINDVKHIQVALELYRVDNHKYPMSTNSGTMILGEEIKGLGKTGWLPNITYSYGPIPGNTTPGGIAFVYCTTKVGLPDCANSTESYVIKFELEQDVSEKIKAGIHFATPSGIE